MSNINIITITIIHINIMNISIPKSCFGSPGRPAERWLLSPACFEHPSLQLMAEGISVLQVYVAGIPEACTEMEFRSCHYYT